MPASLILFQDPDLERPFERVHLQDMSVVDGIGNGQPMQIWGHVAGTSHLRMIEISLGGPGAENVQLAIDDDGKPAVWSAEGILIDGGGTIFSGEKFSFWVRGVYAFDDREDSLPFDFNIKAKAIG